MDIKYGDIGKHDAQALPLRSVDLAHEADFVLGNVRVTPSLRAITGPKSERKIEPKMMQVLVTLAQARGNILTRDDLIDLCWNGRVVGDNSVNRIMSLLRSALRDVGAEGVTIDNVPKVGFRLLAEGMDDALSPSANPLRQEDAINSPTSRNVIGRPAILIAGLLALLGAAVALTSFYSRPSLLDPITIAMLPEGVSTEGDGFFARGITAAIRDELIHQDAVEVTSAKSAEQMVASGQSVEQMGEILDADYLLLLDVEQNNSVVVLKARLVSVDGKRTIWADTLRSADDGAYELPRRIRRNIMEALNRPLSGSMMEARVAPADFTLYIIAMGKLLARERDDQRSANQLLEQVVARNPNFAAGLAGLAKAKYLNRSPEQSQQQLDIARAQTLARRALEIDSEVTDALKVLGKVASASSDQLAYLNRAVEVDPSDPEAWYWLSIVQQANDAPGDEIVHSIDRLVDIDPLWPPAWNSPDIALMMGRHDLARELEEKIIAAAARPAQATLARARMSRLNGDLAGFLTMFSDVRPRLNQAEEDYGAKLQVQMTRRLLNLERIFEPLRQRQALLYQIEDGTPASSAQIAAVTLDGDVFADHVLATEQIRVLYNQDRTREIIVLFDERFNSVSDIASWAKEEGIATWFLPTIASNLSPALRKVGRIEESRQLVRIAESELASWNIDRGLLMERLVTENRLAASNGETDRMLRTLEEMITRGWPFTVSHAPVGYLAPIIPDRLYDRYRGNPEFRRLLEPVRALVERERRTMLQRTSS